VNLIHGNMIANKVKIDLDVLGALVLDGVRWHVYGANIFAKHNRSWRRWSMKLVEELANPTGLDNSVSHNMILASVLKWETMCCRFDDHETINQTISHGLLATVSIEKSILFHEDMCMPTNVL
jgi:hypothetical protein